MIDPPRLVAFAREIREVCRVFGDKSRHFWSFAEWVERAYGGVVGRDLWLTLLRARVLVKG